MAQEADFWDALNAAIPHMASQYRYPLHFSVKLSELLRLQNSYASQTSNSSASATQKSSWRQDMLRAMRPHFPEEQQKRIDMLATYFEVQTFMHDFLYFKEDFII